MEEEKRSSVRWKKKIRVAYSLTEGNEAYQEIFTEDISEKGIQILIPGELKMKQVIKLKIEFIYDSVPIVSLARVAYVKANKDRNRIGLEFVNMDDFDKQRLKWALGRLNNNSSDGI